MTDIISGGSKIKDYTFHSSSFHRINVVLILSVLYMLIFLTACPKVIDIEKKSIIRITGTVTDKNTGLSIADANVRLFFTDPDHKNPTVKSTKTDSSGQYYLEYDGPIRSMEPRGYAQFSLLSLESRAEGYSPRYTLIVETIELQTINFQLHPIILIHRNIMLNGQLRCLGFPEVEGSKKGLAGGEK